MKTAKLKGIALIFLVIIVTFLPQVNANPVVITTWHPYIFLELLFLFIITFIIESIIIKIFLRPFALKEASKKFYKSVFTVNLVTFPLTQLFAFLLNRANFFDLGYLLFVSIAIEIFPIILECLLNIKIFSNFNNLNYFEYQVNYKTIVKSTITANLVTFAIGIPIFLIF